jgi:hypothetical protein
MVLTNPDAKLLYIWSWTNEHNGMAGLYKIHEAMICVETGLSVERLRDALAQIAEHEFAFYIEGVMFVRTRAKRLRTRSPQIAKSIARDVSQIRSDHPLRIRFCETYEEMPWLRPAFQGLRLTRASSEAHESADKQGDGVSLTRASLEAPRSGSGLSSSSKEDLSDQRPNHARAEMRQVFDAWIASTGRTTRTVFSAERQRIIRNALKVFPLVDLLDAVDGWRFSGHHRGENDSSTVYNDIELLLKDAKHVEKFRDLKRRAPHLNGNGNGYDPDHEAGFAERLNRTMAERQRCDAEEAT